MVEGFRVGHKAKHAARGVGEARYGKGRTVGVQRIFLRGLAGGRISILQGNEVFGLKAAQRFLVTGNQLAFAVAHGHGEQGQVFGKHARACRIGQQVHPAVFKPGRIVVAQRNLAFKALAAKGGQHAQLYKQLKTVADAQNQLALIQKLTQALQQGRARVVFKVAPAHGRSLGRAEVVAVQKPAGKNQKVIVGKANLGRHQIGKMHHISLVCTSKTGRVGGFHVRICAVAGDDQCIDRTHAGEASLACNASVSGQACAWPDVLVPGKTRLSRIWRVLRLRCLGRPIGARTLKRE